MAIKIPAMDLMFYLMETPENPKHVGAVQIFEAPSDAPEDYLRNLVAALKRSRPEAPFCYRPHFPRTGMPEWVEDDAIEMDYHVRHSALPRPGTMSQLMTVIERLHAGALDRKRPGWICQLVEGLEGNRFALYAKVHHAYIDGMSGVRRMYGALSTSPDERTLTPMWAYRASGQQTKKPSREGLAERARSTRRTALTQSKAIAELYGVFARLGLQALKLRESDVPMPFTAPRTLTNRPVRWDTRSIAVCTLPLDRVHAIGEKAGGKVNDVVLALVDAALRDYLAGRPDDVDDSLVALCPMSVRAKGDDSATTQVATVLVRLGTPRAAIRERLEQVIASSRAAKEEARSMSRDALMNFVLVFAGVAEILARSGLEQSVSPSCNVLVSNVPGPGDDAMYMGGSRLLASYPISTLAPGVNLNATVLSHGNNLDFGLLGDKHAMPDIERVARRMEHHFAALEQAVLGAAAGALDAAAIDRSDAEGDAASHG